MPAGKATKGGPPPEKHGRSTDVNKAELEAAASDAASTKASEDSRSEETSEEKEKVSFELSEEDLEEFEKESQRIPYSRFKEVNDAKKSLEKQLNDLSARQQEDVRRAVEDAELRIAARIEREKEVSGLDEYSDPTEREIRTLRDTINALKSEVQNVKQANESSSLTSKIDRLSQKYPDADPTAVLGWAKVRPNADLEELMALSHEQTQEKVKILFRNMVAKKKAKAKNLVPQGDGGVRLKAEDRPKTLKQSRNLLRRWATK